LTIRSLTSKSSTSAGEGIHLDRQFLSRLVGKVYQERTKRADRWTLNYALAAFEDTMT
jgi:hypothetical protein